MGQRRLRFNDDQHRRLAVRVKGLENKLKRLSAFPKLSSDGLGGPFWFMMPSATMERAEIAGTQEQRVVVPLQVSCSTSGHSMNAAASPYGQKHS